VFASIIIFILAIVTIVWLTTGKGNVPAPGGPGGKPGSTT